MRRSVSVRFSEQELDVIDEAARRAGLLRAEWLRHVALQAARVTLRTALANRLDTGLQDDARTLLTEASEEVSRLREAAEVAPRANATQKVLDIVDETGVDFFLDEHGTPFATFPVAGEGVGGGMVHVQTWPLRSRQLSGWCRTRYHAGHGKPIPSNALRAP